MKYKLLKDLPGVKAGATFEQKDVSDYGSYYAKQDQDYFFTPQEIEENPDWFAPFSEHWRPISGQSYYFISAIGEVVELVWLDSDEQHLARYRFGNCFEDEEFANNVVKKIRDVLMESHKQE